MFNREMFYVSPSKASNHAVEIKEVLIEGYNALARPPAVKRKASFAPSSIGYGSGTCARRWYLSFEGKYVFDESSTDHMGIANMDNGTYFHDRLGKLIQSSSADVTLEQEFSVDSPPIRGFIDAIIDSGSGPVVVEAKSTKAEIFEIRKNSNKPPAYHIYQVIIYMKALSIEHGVILYENKNDQSMLLIPLTMNDYYQDVIDDAWNWMRAVHNNWSAGPDGGNLPVRPWKKTNKNCKSCPLFDACWNKLPEGNVDLSPMEVVSL